MASLRSAPRLERTSSFGVPGVLVFSPLMELDAFTLQVSARFKRGANARFAVGDQLARRSMKTYPELVNSLTKRALKFIRHDATWMPTSATIEHMEDGALEDEHQITFHLLVELVR